MKHKRIAISDLLKDTDLLGDESFEEELIDKIESYTQIQIFQKIKEDLIIHFLNKRITL